MDKLLLFAYSNNLDKKTWLLQKKDYRSGSILYI